jgi:2-dehydropantoate 2-reductase
MKIVVVGAGAMGSLFASYLASVSKDVWVYDIWQEHIEVIKREGLLIARNGTDRRVWLKATSNPADPGISDLVIILVKYISTRQAVKDAMPMISPQTAVLTLQNGIGNVEILQEMIPTEQILFGMTTLPCELLGPGHIESSGHSEGETHFWPLSGKTDTRANEICSIFNQAGIQTRISPDIQLKIWKKLAVICSYAAMSAVTRLKVGELIDRAEIQPILEGLISEVAMIAKNKGISLERNEGILFARQVAEEGRDHIPSILADILKNRKTEVECLNGAVVREGEKLGVSTPFNQALNCLIHCIENTYTKRLG